MSLAAFAWSSAACGEALTALARHKKWRTRNVRAPRTDDLDHAAAWLGMEAEEVDALYGDVDVLVETMAPAMLDLREPGAVPSASADDEAKRWLAIVRSSRRRSTLLLPNGRTVDVPTSELRDVLTAATEREHGSHIAKVLEEAQVPQARRARAQRALFDRALALYRVRGVTLCRLPPSAPLVAQARSARVIRRLAGVVMAHTLRYVLVIAGWWLVGKAALEGRTDVGLLSGWALLLISQIPFVVWATFAQGIAAIDMGAILKRRMLAGGLGLESDIVRSEGAGHLLGRVIEADAVEQLAVGAGFAAVTGFIELTVAIVVLLGGASTLTGVLLVGWTILTLAFCMRYARHRAGWTDARLSMTHDLVERMVGHRTRLAQQSPERFHEGEDELLDGYVKKGSALDTFGARIWAGLPRGWLVVALASFVPTLATSGLSTTSTEASRLAVSVGATLLAYRALKKVVVALANAAGAGIGWDKARPLFDGTKNEKPPATAEPAPVPPPGKLRLEASGVTFRYRSRGEAVLAGASVTIAEGDRVLIEGRSGSGKSTLANVLCGLREPDGGLVLVGGLDRQTLGLSGFRRHIAAAPQFHDNFVFGSTLAFNLLMGRRWPASDADLKTAEDVCRDLGLGPLLDRMPSGLNTQVGETGWQLSHGERSRVYLARALLQNARILVLDESFGALDPPTLEKVCARVLAEPSAIVVIAHP